MRKIFGCLAVLIICFSGCAELGEDPQPFPGHKDDGTVVLFRNGAIYNHDYTVQYDGLEIPEYTALRPEYELVDGVPTLTGNTVGGPFTSISSTEGGSAVLGGTKSMLFEHDLKNNYEASWRVTMFDEPEILASNFNRLTFMAKYGGGMEAGAGAHASSDITITVWGSSGVQITIGSGTLTIVQRDGQWYEFSIPLELVNRNPKPEWLRADERIKQWQITVGQNAGRIYIDEIVLRNN